MPRRPSAVALAPLLAFAVAACGEPKPWSVPGWRPEAPPRRIVAASLLSAEVLLAIAPRERLAGVIYLAADPAFSLVVDQAAGLPLVGADPEQLLAVRPDLVICDAFTRPETLALLGAADVPVVATADAASFADIAANVRLIGRLCHVDEQAAQLVDAMQERLGRLAARAGELRDWRIANLDGGLHTHGAGSLFDAVAAAVGARNLARERGAGAFRKLDVETLLGWRPDALVLGGDPASTPVVPRWVQDHAGLSLLPCVGAGRVVRVPGPLLATTSPRLVEAAERLQQALLAWGRP